VLVGRRQELGLVEGALERARTGRAAVVLLCGEPGIGKSRLAEEAAARAEERDMQVGWGRAWEEGGAPAFWPWIQVLRALRRSAAGDEDLAELARLLPEVRAAPPAGESADDRFAMFDAVLRFLAASTAQRPALIVLEDLHAADLASLQLLAFVAAHLRDAGLAVIGTYRDLEAGQSPACADLLQRTGRCGQLVGLRRLARDEVGALAAAARAGTIALDEDAVDQIHHATDGNPLFVVELLRLLPPGQPLSQPLPLPAGVRALVRQRLAGLTGERRALLAAAATIGREFAAPLLASVCGRPLAEVATDLAAAEEAGLVAERAPSRHGFSHGLFAEALRQDPPPDRRAALHLAIAGELERQHAGDPAAPLAEIAHHLLEAGPAAAERAVAAARRAAEAAVRQLAFEEAAALLERAAAVPGGVQTRAELLLGMAHARTLAGEVDAGRAACLEAAALARSLGAPELLGRAAIGYGAAFTFGVIDDVLVALLEETLAALPPDDSPTRARVLARLAAALQPARDPGQPMAIARQAIMMAHRIGDQRTRLDVLHAASASMAKYGPPAERLAIDAETLELAARLGEPSLALRAHARLMFDHLELGDVGASLEDLRSYEDLAAELARPRARWPGAMFRAMFALYEGRFADQERHLGEAGAWMARAGENHGPLSLEMHRIGTLRARGDDAGLEGRSSRLWRQLRASHDIYDRTLRWMILARLGRIDELRASLARSTPGEVVTLGDPTVVTWAAESVALVRDRVWASALIAWLEPRAPLVALQAMLGMFVEGSLSRPLYLLADVLDRADLCRAALDSALATARGHAARPLEARVLYEWGTIRGARGDAAESRRCLEEALAIASSMELPLRARIAAALGERGDVADEGVALAREGDTWTIRGEGGTIRLRDSRGLDMLARLVAQPGREIHALELTGAREAGVEGDAGEMLDRDARERYRARLREIEAERDQARAWNDAGRAERLAGEEEALRRELARAVGLGGRARRAGDASERARVNAQRRLADAIRRIQDGHAALGAHLARSVRTGIYCCYDPAHRR
jgi:hypothetical protein